MNSRFAGLDPKRIGFAGQDFAGRVAVVTGSGRGIGKELALLLARLGAAVAVAELSPEGGAVADAIRESGGRAIWVETDVSREESVAALAERVRAELGPADLLVNNAIYSPVGPLLAMELAEWDRVMAVNLRGAVLCLRAFLPGMIERGQGAVANLISAPSMPYMAAYACTKQALESLTHSLAGELQGKGVSVFAYGPGMVATPGGEASFRKLAPLLGLTYDQLTRSGINPGYEGLVPAYDSALVLAYLLAHAPDYHDQTVQMHEVVENLASLAQEQGGGIQAGPRAAQRASQGLDLDLQVELLQEVLRLTESEFGRLPFFVRPMARSGFQRKAGLGLKAFQDLLDRFQVQLSRRESAAQETAERLAMLLPGLCTYYREVPQETARFIRNPEDLAKIADAAREREKAGQKLLSLLNSAK